jgi:hypothetical protein
MAPTSAIVERATPVWAWLVGGALAIGLGIGGALWFAGRGDEPAAAAAPAAVKPAAVKAPIESTPIVPDVKPMRFVELRFDSLPAGAVFEDGHSAELCHTPCSFNVDLQDGGALDKRVYLVRADGFADGTINVDLSATQREFGVTLQRIAAMPTRPPIVDKRHPSGRKPTGVAAKKPEPVLDDKLEPPPVVPEKPVAKPTAIDASETLDPFHRKTK